ncbi:hypothetical protein ACHAWF_014151 [Thalassiosira exigua]
MSSWLPLFAAWTLVLPSGAAATIVAFVSSSATMKLLLLPSLMLLGVAHGASSEDFDGLKDVDRSYLGCQTEVQCKKKCQVRAGGRVAGCRRVGGCTYKKRICGSDFDSADVENYDEFAGDVDSIAAIVRPQRTPDPRLDRARPDRAGERGRPMCRKGCLNGYVLRAPCSCVPVDQTLHHRTKCCHRGCRFFYCPPYSEDEDDYADSFDLTSADFKKYDELIGGMEYDYE